MDGPTIACIVLIALASAASLSAQEADAETAIQSGEAGDVTQAEAVEDTCEKPQSRLVTLPKLTPVYISIDAAQGSKTSNTGDTFPITVTEPVMAEGVEVIPAGTQGLGEVIHAKKAGGSGAGGELILTANYIDFGEQRIPLRSLKLGLSGKAQTGLAIATGPVGFLVRGKNVDVAEGTLAGAKLAEDTEILLPQADDAEAADCREGT
ncbi:hypothetical protein [Altererythrobacter lutimaris]|uniref:Uncharacterized protein n=1 Tax=Altererythrobacter lutimaris TaxID=2743979 RepID=A0A850H912_9SPHN|nr:hypothetical protein [Altererythrobacter lutimaris]NVE94269.1 hypothetical protein [Altererythrobacter lutimaris]